VSGFWTPAVHARSLARILDACCIDVVRHLRFVPALSHQVLPLFSVWLHSLARLVGLVQLDDVASLVDNCLLALGIAHPRPKRRGEADARGDSPVAISVSSIAEPGGESLVEVERDLTLEVLTLENLERLAEPSPRVAFHLLGDHLSLSPNISMLIVRKSRALAITAEMT